MRISDWSSDVCSSDLEFTLADDGLRDLIRYYTREAGVRTLEREIARLARKALRSILEGKADKVVITPANIGDYAGVRKFRFGVGEEEDQIGRSEEHTSELQSLMRISYAVFCLKKKKHPQHMKLIKQ